VETSAGRPVSMGWAHMQCHPGSEPVTWVLDTVFLVFATDIDLSP